MVLPLKGATKMIRKIPNLTVRNGIFETRIQIPADVRNAYGKTVEQVSHGTRDFAAALIVHERIVQETKGRIEALRLKGMSPSVETPSLPATTPQAAFRAIRTWAERSAERN